MRTDDATGMEHSYQTKTVKIEMDFHNFIRAAHHMLLEEPLSFQFECLEVNIFRPKMLRT